MPKQPAGPPPAGLVAMGKAPSPAIFPRGVAVRPAIPTLAVRPGISALRPTLPAPVRPASGLSTVIAPRDGRSGVAPQPGFEAGTQVVGVGKLQELARSQLAKTTLCMRWQTTGICALGTNCTFAHGEEELRKADVAAVAAPTPASDNPLDCKFGRLCKRPECWFQHPQGRIIDQDPKLTMCRFGNECGRVDCFYVHPKDMESEHFILHIDEIPMPNRPKALATKSDREVFMDPLPHEAGSPELDEFLKALGEYEDVYQIPNQDRGYVRFKHHKDAAGCVEALAGQWSESERACLRKRNRGMKGQNAYPDSVVMLLRGKDACNVKELMDKTGVKQLRLLDGFKASDTSVSGRICFSGKGSPAQQLQLKIELEELLGGIHTKLSEMLEAMRSRELDVWGVPEGWSDDEINMLFNQHGEIAGKELLGRGHVKVVYMLADDAEKAAQELDGLDMSEFGASSLQCQMVRDRVVDRNSASVFVGNLPFEATEEELREVVEKIGPVQSIRMGVDRERKSKGFAFVDFETREDAKRATEEYLNMNDRRLRINWADRSGGGGREEESRGRKRHRSEERRRDDGHDLGSERQNSDEQWSNDKQSNDDQSWKRDSWERRDSNRWGEDGDHSWGKDKRGDWGSAGSDEPASSRRRYGDYDHHEQAPGGAPPGFWGAPRPSSSVPHRPPAPPPAHEAPPAAPPAPPAAPRVNVKRAIVARPPRAG